MVIIGNTAFDFGGNDFLLPYIQRRFSEMESGDEPSLPLSAGVKIATDENQGSIDAEFEDLCSRSDLAVVTLRCPYIVGTGMTGLLRKIAAGIYKGTYVNIKGNEARISVVHAVDVANAAFIASGIQGAYTLTDRTDPMISDLACAFATRLDDKRILTIKPRWAKIWYGSTYYTDLTTDKIAPDTFADVFPDFEPVKVTEYLTTHVYDESSL